MNIKKEIGWLLKEKYGGVETPEFRKDIQRLQKGAPLDYVIGFTNFLGCKIDLSKRPLIPRTETEFWVEQVLKDLRRVSQSARQIQVLDIFAGSGCVGISIMRHIKNSKVIFAEKNKKIIYQIKINCKINNISTQKYKIIQSDIFSNITGTFDYIFANPPYIATIQKKNIQKSVLDYEPHAALFGGSDGLLYIKGFLSKAKNFLNPDGKIYMEFDPPQKKSIEKLLKKYHYTNHQFYKDQYKKFRYVGSQH